MVKGSISLCGKINHTSQYVKNKEKKCLDNELSMSILHIATLEIIFQCFFDNKKRILLFGG